jgi:hypothetical protein
MPAAVLEESDNVRARRFQLASQGIDIDATFMELAEELAEYIRRHRHRYRAARLDDVRAAETVPYLPGVSVTDTMIGHLHRSCDAAVRDWDDGKGIRFGVIASSIDETLQSCFRVVAVFNSRERVAEATLVVNAEGSSCAVEDVRWAERAT